MTASAPVKTRELRSNMLDSEIWNEVVLRDDDIIIASWGKSGTTWVQQIVGQILSGGAADQQIAQVSPWVDLRIPPKPIKLPQIAALTGRRFLKTHLPTDALTWSEKVSYLYVGRDGRDVVWSMYNHHARANDSWYTALNNAPGRVGPPMERPTEDIVQYFAEWLDRDGYPWWPFWDNIRSWWAARDQPNVRFLHFNELKSDLAGQIAATARFLGVALTPSQQADALAHSTFEYMKENAAAAAPLGGIFWEGGPKTFINKGTNNRWRDVLPKDLSAAYEARAVAELGADCAHWLKTGER